MQDRATKGFQIRRIVVQVVADPPNLALVVTDQLTHSAQVRLVVTLDFLQRRQLILSGFDLLFQPLDLLRLGLVRLLTLGIPPTASLLPGPP
ncbi:hypothetical protein G6F35_018344 [Rhizopus arrhizus]|nr:hypothetical protein G6F35_018344 [Rhizopus arrhizus]